MHKQWTEAEQRYDKVGERYPESKVTPETVYWRGVSRYKATNDHTALGEVAEQFKQKYQESIRVQKASV